MHAACLWFAVWQYLVVIMILVILSVPSSGSEQQYSYKPDTEFTPMDFSQDPTRRAKIQQTLLQLFQMDERPSPEEYNIPEVLYEPDVEVKPVRLSAKDRIYVPQYMWDIYEYFVNDEGDLPDGYEDHLGSNTVRSFTHEDIPSRHKRSLDSASHTQHLKFTVNRIPKEEELVGAHIRFYKEGKQETNYYNALSYSEPHQLNLYEVLTGSGEIESSSHRTLLESRIVMPHEGGWESFDVTGSINKWRKDNETNHGFIAEYRTLSGSALNHSHVRLRRDTSLFSDSSSDINNGPRDTSTNSNLLASPGVVQQPLLVAYTHDKKLPRTHSSKKSRKNQRTKRRAKRKMRIRQRKINNLCRVHGLHVNFKEVSWDDWIIAPASYEAKFCYGVCQWPFPQGVNTTNHAIVQVLLHSAKPQVVPPPCCVPTEFSELPLLFMDEDEHPILKRYQKMIVTDCGCR